MNDVDTDWAASESWTDDMMERMRWLRANDPVYWSEKTQHWILSRFEEVSTASKNPELFCSGEGILPGITVRQGLIDEDAPRHTRLRGLINRGFTPRMVKKLEAAFREITTDAIDAVARRGECDFVKDIAVPHSLIRSCARMGVRFSPEKEKSSDGN